MGDPDTPDCLGHQDLSTRTFEQKLRRSVWLRGVPTRCTHHSEMTPTPGDSSRPLVQKPSEHERYRSDEQRASQARVRVHRGVEARREAPFDDDSGGPVVREELSRTLFGVPVPNIGFCRIAEAEHAEEDDEVRHAELPDERACERVRHERSDENADAQVEPRKGKDGDGGVPRMGPLRSFKATNAAAAATVARAIEATIREMATLAAPSPAKARRRSAHQLVARATAPHGPTASISPRRVRRRGCRWPLGAASRRRRRAGRIAGHPSGREGPRLRLWCLYWPAR